MTLRRIPAVLDSRSQAVIVDEIMASNRYAVPTQASVLRTHRALLLLLKDQLLEAVAETDDMIADAVEDEGRG
jgi:hypothetical protein